MEIMERQTMQRAGALCAGSDVTINLLKSVPCFSGLGPHVLATLAGRCQSRSFQTGQFVFVEGHPCRHLYILESGRVFAYRSNAEGREQTLRRFDHPGDVFCIPSAFSVGRHIVSVRAGTEARLQLIDVDTVTHLSHEHPSIALKIIAMTGVQMARLVTLAEDLSLKTVTARLAKHLCESAEDGRGKPGEPMRLSRDRLSEGELASLLGTVRVHVSRSLTSLVRAGAISRTRESIRILDLTVLREISGCG
jgi:CRP-like cAMP-binding protein